MTVETRTETREVTTYISEDKRSFRNKLDCEIHEWKNKASIVYLVSKRGQRADAVECYSTRELAKEALGTSDLYNITEVYIDYRFWNKQEKDK